MFTCPECHGTLFEIDDEQVLRFRCHVGHALTAESLAADQVEALEATLWAAVRSFEERAELSGPLAPAPAARHATTGCTRSPTARSARATRRRRCALSSTPARERDGDDPRATMAGDQPGATRPADEPLG